MTIKYNILHCEAITDTGSFLSGASNNNGLAICVTRRTKTGVYRGQLTKTNALVNGGKHTNFYFALYTDLILIVCVCAYFFYSFVKICFICREV